MFECKFYINEGNCEVLTMGNKRNQQRSCRNCKFMLSEKQYQKQINKVNERLRGLPIKQQKHIADKYYGGLMEWRL